MLYEIILLLRMSICNTDFSMHGEKKSIIIRQLVINWQEDPEDDYQMSETCAHSRWSCCAWSRNHASPPTSALFSWTTSCSSYIASENPYRYMLIHRRNSWCPHNAPYGPGTARIPWTYYCAAPYKKTLLGRAARRDFLSDVLNSHLECHVGDAARMLWLGEVNVWFSFLGMKVRWLLWFLVLAT
jgi:hypothetical protein